MSLEYGRTVDALTDLHVVDNGADPSSPLVVVVHGAMDRASSFGRVARSLSDLQVVRYDRRGYGRSVGAGPAPLAVHVDDLLAVLAGRPATVFGHSVGAVVALVAAQSHPGLVRSVLAFEPPTPWLPWWPNRAGAAAEGAPALDTDPADEAEAFMVAAVGERIWARLPARTRADRRAEGGALRADLASLQGPAPFDPAAVSVPVVVGCGSQTTWWHRQAAEELAAALPVAELAVVGGATHGAHLTHPSAMAELVREAVAASERSEERR